MSEKIKVLICCTERVTYNQVVEMSKADFEKWDARLDDEDADDERTAADIMDIFIDRTEPYDDADPEVFEFRRFSDKEASA